MCFLEYLVFTKDLQERDVGVRITLQLDECPPLPEKLKTRRIQSHTVTIVRPTTDSADTTQIFMTSEVDMFKGSGFSSVATFKKLMTTLSSMALYADSKKISTYGILDRSSWAPKKAWPNCSVCNRKFSTTRRRQHCRLCGEVACRRCMTVRDAPNLDDNATSTPRTFQVVKTTFCKACMGKIRGSDVTNSIAGIGASARCCCWPRGPPPRPRTSRSTTRRPARRQRPARLAVVAAPTDGRCSQAGVRQTAAVRLSAGRGMKRFM